MSRRLLLANNTTVTVPPPGSGGGGDAALFNTAISQVAAAGGTVVFTGSYTIATPITIPSGVWLVGMGWKASRLKLADGAECPVVRTNPDAAVKYAGLSGFYIDGNRANNTAGHGIQMVNPKPDQTNGECSVNIVEDVLVEYAATDSFYVNDGQVETRVFNCYSFSPRRNGFRMDGSDYWMTDCTSGESGAGGILLSGYGPRLSGCKSWWSGRQVPPNTPSNPGSGTGSGIGIEVAADNAQITNCEVQDSSGYGLAVGGNGGRIQVHVDANNAAGVTTNPCLVRLGNANRIHLDINIGTGTGRPAAPYVLDIANSNGNLVDIWNGCTPRTLYRPGSEAVGTNTVNAKGVYV